MGVGEEKDIFDEMSLSLLMYNISQNGIKFAKLKSKELTDIGECYYLLKIYYSERELSQEDLCDIFCQSKGTVAKTLRKLEDKGYIRLKEGDMFSTTVKNTNTTIAQQLRGFFYKIAGNENAQVAAKHGGVVSVNGSAN